MKSIYPVLRLGELVNVKGGKRLPKGAGYAGQPTKHPYLRVCDFTNSSIDETDLQFLTEETQSQISRYVISSDDVYISIAGTIGLSGLVPEHLDGANLTENAAKLVIRDKTIVDKRYLALYLRTNGQREIKIKTKATSQPKLALFRIEELEIPLPPIDEQRRIATILDKADAVRRKRKEVIALTEDLLRSAFLEMFGDPATNPKGWNTTTLGEALSDIESGWSPKCDPREAKKEEWGVLKLGAVTYGDYNESEHKTLLPEYVPRPEIEVKRGDLLFSRKNTYELVGASAYVYQTRSGLMLPDLIFRLCCRAEVDSVYLWQALSQKTTRSQLTGLASGSSGSMPNISKSRLRTLTVPIPPLPLQQKYRSVAQRLRINQQRQVKNCGLTEDLFNSLLQRAFRGDL